MGIHGLMPEHADAPEHKFQGRVPILITDQEKRDAYIHFVALPPEGVTYQAAMTAVTDAFTKVRVASPDEWNYGELEEELKKIGYTTFSVNVWEEEQDGYPPGSPDPVGDEEEPEDDDE